MHGHSGFNRELVKDHGAPAGRLMLHCLRLSLPTLPETGSKIWGSAEKTVNMDTTKKTCGENIQSPEEERSTGEKESGETLPVVDNRKASSGPEECCTDKNGVETVPISPESSLRSTIENDVGKNVHVTSVPGSPLTQGSDEKGRVGGSLATSETTAGKGIEVYCPPPGDMLEFLRSMAWWEEGIIDAAELTGRNERSPKI